MTALPMMLMSEDEVASFGRRPDAGFGALTCAAGALPLTALDVEARVAGVLAAIEVAQTFVNTTGGPIEATYIFPLPDRAAVHRFRMEVAGRVIDGVVEERGAAREQYDQAIAAGQRAAITEEERPGVFTLRVGNLMPGEAATVRLSLVGPLPVDDGEVTLRFPLVVAPRYIPGAALGGEQAGLGAAGDTDVVPDASRISPPVRLPGLPNPVRLGIRVILAPEAVTDVASSLHAVTARRADGWLVEVQPGERLDRDFVLRWRTAPAAGHALRSALTCVDDADGAGGTFALTLVPPSTVALGGKPRDVVFVIDRSGSMGGWKMVAARRAAARMIDTLTSRDRFCAIAFDHRVEPLPEAGLVAATDRNRFRAVEALAKVDAAGGTEMLRPLVQAAELLAGYDDRERVIVLVTDGQVGNEDQLLAELAPRLRATRVFALGIDQAVNAAFLRRVAGAGGGLCELVESEDRLDAVMAKVHRRIGLPVATDLHLVARGLEIDAASVTPRKLPDLYAGAPVVVLGRYRGRAPADAALQITGTAHGEGLDERVGREPSEGAPASAWLAASWARGHVRDLEDRYAAGERHHEAAIVATSKRFSVLSRFTAFLAIDRSEIANRSGRMTSVVQPVEPPAGWADAGAAPRGGPVGGMAMPMPAAKVMASPAAPAGAPPPITLRAPSPQSISGRPSPASPPPSVASERARSRPAAAAAMPPPPPPAAMPSVAAPLPMEDRASMKDEAAPATVPPAYLTRLTALAEQVTATARATPDATGTALVRLLWPARQRIAEWLEDLRSTGAFEALASAVEALARELAQVSDVAAALAVADSLTKLGAGTWPAAPPPKKSRLAFWK